MLNRKKFKSSLSWKPCSSVAEKFEVKRKQYFKKNYGTGKNINILCYFGSLEKSMC